MAAKNEDYTAEQVSEMIAQCADALRAEFEAEAELAKSSKDEPADETAGSSGPSAPVEESPEGTPPAEETPGEDTPGAPPEASASAPPEASSPSPDASPSPDGQAIEPAPTLEALQAEYMKLPPDQKRLHYLAAKAALVADMGAQGSPDGVSPVGSPAASASPAPAVTGSPSPAPMAMGEMGAGKKLPGNPGNGGKVQAGKLGKSEPSPEVEELRKRLDEKDQELKAQTDAVEKLTKAVSALATPVRQSIKNLSDVRVIAKTEEPAEGPKAEIAKMSKTEIQAVLCERIRGGKLSKADKQKISEYTAGGLDVSKIAHLLVDAK